MGIRDLLEMADRSSKVRSVDPDCPLRNIIPEKETKDNFRNRPVHRPDNFW